MRVASNKTGLISSAFFNFAPLTKIKFLKHNSSGKDDFIYQDRSKSANARRTSEASFEHFRATDGRLHR